jgi:hypothetical protein
MSQGEAASTSASLLAVLSGATALRKLSMLADTHSGTFAHCTQLRQLTALEVGPLTGRSYAEQFDSCLSGLTQLQSLRLRFHSGAAALLYAVPALGGVTAGAGRTGRLRDALRLPRLPSAGSSGQEPRGFPPVLWTMTALTHLSFGVQRPSLDPRHVRCFVFNELPAELFQQLRRLRHLEFLNCGINSLPADVGLLTGGTRSWWSSMGPLLRVS